MKKPLKITLLILSLSLLIGTFTLSTFADSGLLTPDTWTYYHGVEEITLFRDSDSDTLRDGYFSFNTDGYTQRLGVTTIDTVWRDRLSCYYDNNGTSSNVTIDAYNDYIESTTYGYGLLNKAITLGTDSVGSIDYFPTHIGIKDMFAYVDNYQGTNFTYPLFSITVSPDNTQWLDNALNSGSISIGFTTFTHTDTSSINTRRFVQNVTYRVVTQTNEQLRYDFCLDLSTLSDLYANSGYAYLMDIGIDLSPSAINEMAYGSSFILALYTWHYDDYVRILPNGADIHLNLLPVTYLDSFLDVDLFLDGTEFNLFAFFSNAIGGFFAFEIAPGFTLGNIGFTVVAIGLLFAILKYFAGG